MRNRLKKVKAISRINDFQRINRKIKNSIRMKNCFYLINIVKNYFSKTKTMKQNSQILTTKICLKFIYNKILE